MLLSNVKQQSFMGRLLFVHSNKLAVLTCKFGALIGILHHVMKRALQRTLTIRYNTSISKYFMTKFLLNWRIYLIILWWFEVFFRHFQNLERFSKIT